jgi:PAS domain S-box-containing protein
VGGAVALGALIGWWLNVAPLRSLHPALVAMNPLTASCFILAGLALWLLRTEEASARTRSIALACAGAVVLAGLTKFVSVVIGHEILVDEAFLRSRLAALTPLVHNRMAPNTAFGFVFLGSSLLALGLQGRRRWWATQLLPIPCLLLGVLAVLGYAYGVTHFYGVASYTPMALNSAFTFVVLAAGTLAARTDRGLAAAFVREDASSYVLRRLLPGALLFLVVLGWLELQGEARRLLEPRFGVSLLVALDMLVLVAIVGIGARSLARADAQRRRAVASLERAHGDLENQVLARTARIVEVNHELQRSLRAMQQMQYSIDHAADAVLWNDEQGRFVYVNQSACKSLGYEQEELLGLTVFDINPALRPERWGDRWDEVRTAGAITVESEHRRKDGSVFPVEITVDHVEFEGKAFNCVIARDITQRRVLEDQFRQAQKMEGLGRLAGGVAHDFNNLLTVIMCHGEFIRRKLDPGSSVLADVQEVLNASSRAAGLTRQLLAFSRRQMLEPTVVSLNTIIADMDRMLRRLIGEDVDLVTATAADLGLTRVDRGQLEQILMNLAVNARDAMPSGGRLTIETSNVDLAEEYMKSRLNLSTGHYVMLAVSDTGSGMTPEVKARAFEPFYTTKEVGKGTGLGLSTVHGIVTQSGGDIELFSEPGRGTTFKIYLPRLAGAPGASSGAVAPQPSSGHETLLLVEDESVIRSAMRHSLEHLGYQVLEAADGRDALALCERPDQPVDVLVTDVVMPHMNGPELVERARRVRPNLRVLYMSGYADRALIHQGMRDPDTSFLQKPFAPETLGRKIREVLDRAA